MCNLSLLKRLMTAVITLPAILLAQENNSLQLTSDSLLCEGEWVTLSTTTTDCTMSSIQWMQVNMDGSEITVGPSVLYSLSDGNLKSRRDGLFRAQVACEDGRQLEAEIEILQELDENCFQLR